MNTNIANIKESRCCFIECRQAEFLPLKCPYCQLLFCDLHKQPSSHQCTNINTNNTRSQSQQSKTNKKCPVCNVKVTIINGYTCKICQQHLCLKHRYQEAHQCKNTLDIKTNILNKQKSNRKNKTNGFISLFVCCKKKKTK